MSYNSTIVAYSGGAMPCAIGIIRLSGPEAIAILHRLFTPKSRQLAHSRLVYGTIFDESGQGIDQCMATIFTAPATYTGEDMCEVYCHGSSIIVSRFLAACQSLGASLAQPGEFTQRAFLNGKMDLTAAEAVNDLIHATTACGSTLALGQLGGGVFHRLDDIYKKISHLAAHFYAVCDYTDEDIEPWHYDDAQTLLTQARDDLAALHATFKRGMLIKQGLPTAIIGRPNVGKSSLLNALVGFERVIVSSLAGTTRDTVEEVLEIGGTHLRLVDTAGIHPTQNPIEKQGITRSVAAAHAAHLAIVVVDGSAPLTQEDAAIFALAEVLPLKIAVINKGDLPPLVQPSDLPLTLDRVFTVSTKTGYGIDLLLEYFAGLTAAAQGEIIITNARQAGLMEQAAQCFDLALTSAKEGMTADVFLLDLEAGLARIADISGRNAQADVVSEIFSTFCVGK